MLALRCPMQRSSKPTRRALSGLPPLQLLSVVVTSSKRQLLAGTLGSLGSELCGEPPHIQKLLQALLFYQDQRNDGQGIVNPSNSPWTFRNVQGELLLYLCVSNVIGGLGGIILLIESALSAKQGGPCSHLQLPACFPLLSLLWRTWKLVGIGFQGT